MARGSHPSKMTGLLQASLQAQQEMDARFSWAQALLSPRTHPVHKVALRVGVLLSKRLAWLRSARLLLALVINVLLLSSYHSAPRLAPFSSPASLPLPAGVGESEQFYSARAGVREIVGVLGAALFVFGIVFLVFDLMNSYRIVLQQRYVHPTNPKMLWALEETQLSIFV